MKTPQSRQAKDDERLLEKIQTFHQASDGAYGSPRVHRDLREDGERCGEHHVARLMRINGLRSIRGYKKPRYRAGKPALVAPNRLEQNFSVAVPDRVLATDITYIRTFWSLCKDRVRRHSHLGHMSPHDFEQAALTPA